MSSFESLELAQDLIRNQGRMENMQIFSLWRYDTLENQRCFKICYRPHDEMDVLESPFVKNPIVLWSLINGITDFGRTILEIDK